MTDIIYRKEDYQIEIIEKDNEIEFRKSVLDIADEPEIISSISFPIFMKPIPLSNNDLVEQNEDLLYKFFDSISEGEYPNSSQQKILQNLVSDELIKNGMLIYCSKNECLCKLALSIGCIDYYLKGSNGKFIKNFFNALAPHFKYGVLAQSLSKIKTIRGEKIDAEERISYMFG
jgi:hypothetical protein